MGEGKTGVYWQTGNIRLRSALITEAFRNVPQIHKTFLLACGYEGTFSLPFPHMHFYHLVVLDHLITRLLEMYQKLLSLSNLLVPNGVCYPGFSLYYVIFVLSNQKLKAGVTTSPLSQIAVLTNFTNTKQCTL